MFLSLIIKIITVICCVFNNLPLGHLPNFLLVEKHLLDANDLLPSGGQKGDQDGPFLTNAYRFLNGCFHQPMNRPLFISDLAKLNISSTGCIPLK